MVLEILLDLFKELIPSLSEESLTIFSLFLYTLFIATYSIFIGKFYKFLASRDIIELNLKQYHHSKSPAFEKFLIIFLYALEYIIILPFLVLFWFTGLSTFFLLLSESSNTNQILLISAAIIASTRIVAYINEDLSKEITKILPLAVLAIFIINSKFLDMTNLFLKISQIPGRFNNLLIFVIFIFLTEGILRVLHLLIKLAYPSSPKEKLGKVNL